MKSQRWSRMIWLTIVLIGVCFFIITYVAQTVPDYNQYRLVRSYPASDTPNRPRTILLWNSFFSDKRWSLPADTLGPDDFRDELRCPVNNCELSINHAFLPSPDMFDAIVFHTAEAFPILNSVPYRRSWDQIYVFALMEPPGETKHILNDEGYFYNLTMTYRLDSDIIWPYKYMEDIESGAIVAPTMNSVWRKPPENWNDTEIWNNLMKKAHNAVWFTSHCKTLSQRENLAQALQQFIDVDIYGNCGPMSCPRSSPVCEEMLDYKYKFYLAFENSLCTDYVTEKLYKALARDIVPVVFGGANYTRFAPPHSYINAEDFGSVQELAVYLKYLAENPAEYMRYFWWRRYYRLRDYSPFCDLCEKLNDLNYLERRETYKNIERWWISGSCRFEANIRF